MINLATLMKSALVGAVMAMAPLAASAATCNIGACGVSGVDGQSLSGNVVFQLEDISNGAGETFEFIANFLNDTSVNGSALVTVLQFEPTGFGTIANLMLTITGPAAIAPQIFAITDAVGNAINPTGNDVVLGIDLTGAAGSSIFFSLTGTALLGSSSGTPPDLDLIISPVPLPAAGFLLIGALGGLGALSRRRKKAA